MSLRNRKTSSVKAESTWLLAEEDTNPLPSPARSGSVNSHNPNTTKEFSFSFCYEEFCKFLDEIIRSIKNIFTPSAPSVEARPLSISPTTTQFMNEFRKHTQIPYDTSNEVHEAILLHYWTLCCPQEELTARKSAQWKELGFQGTDPASDFRGAGIFGLRCLVYFATNYPESFHRLLHPNERSETQECYPFSIAGLNILMTLYELLGWGFKRTPQNPAAAQKLIQFLFESCATESTDLFSHDLLTGTSETYKAKPVGDLLSFDNNEDIFPCDEPSPIREDPVSCSLFYFAPESKEANTEKLFYEMFCFSFVALHKTWFKRQVVAYMDFPFVLIDTKKSIEQYVTKNQISLASIRAVNEKNNKTATSSL